MKLYTTLRSPYGRKAYMVAIEKGLQGKIEIIAEDLKNKSASLLENNPLGQVPVLILDDGSAVYDSPVICEYLDDVSGGDKLHPAEHPDRVNTLKFAALGDGMVENAIAIFYENLKLNAAIRIDEAKIVKHTDTLERCFKTLEARIERLQKDKLDIAQIAVFCALGYINFRLKDNGWEKRYPKLAAWHVEFSKRPSALATMPKE